MSRLAGVSDYEIKYNVFNGIFVFMVDVKNHQPLYFYLARKNTPVKKSRSLYNKQRIPLSVDYKIVNILYFQRYNLWFFQDLCG